MALENFLLNTSAPIDKIVWMDEGEWTSSSLETSKGYVLPTGIDSFLFAMGEWTTDNWATSYPLGTSIGTGQWDEQAGSFTEKMIGTSLYSGLYLNQYAVLLSVYADIPQVNIKYRVYGFIQESAWNATSSETADLSNKFNLDTRNNYPKLFAEGMIDATNSSQNYYHNLGYRPMLRVWSQMPSEQDDLVIFFGNSLDLSIDSQKITFPQGFNYYYRIYADEI